MKKVFKIIALLVVLLIVLVIAYAGYRFASNTETIYPYSYKPIKVDPQEINLAQEADIVLLGDSAAQDMGPYLDLFKEKTLSFLKEPLQIYNWGRAGENLAHTLAKVKSLKKMPLLFIYHGGLDELDRARFNPRYLKTLGNNIKLAQNEKILSTILSLPVASRLIYHPYPHVELNEQALPFPRDLSLEQSLKSLEYLYTLYQWEAMELTNYLRRKDANLWFIPQAYNLLERPSRNCIASGNIQIQNVLKDIEKLLDQKRSKEAVSKLLKIIQNETGHAETYYVLGKAFIKEGQYKKAKKAFYQALILDCDLKRSNPLMLKILMEEVEKKDFKVIDFNRLVTANLGRRLMFEGLRTPQRLYYERLVQELVKRFEQFIRNKE